MSENSSIVAKSKVYVREVIEQKDHPYLAYHNWTHTNTVRKAALKIARAEGLDPLTVENLELAAIFHDIAYFKGWENHEEHGAAMAREFLGGEGVAEERLVEIERIILATKMHTEPSDLLERIIKDADCAHLGSQDYVETSFRNLFQEFTTEGGKNFTWEEWVSMSGDFMKAHQFYTEYARQNFEAQKLTNIAALEGMKDNPNQGMPEPEMAPVPKKKKKKNKEELPVRGIETMFRVALRNHVNLSRIADNKANTLISVNAIIISIVMSIMFPKMDTNPFTIYPGIAMMSFSVLTIIIAILSTIPQTTHGYLSREQVAERKGNLIFFGNFHRMSLEDYEWSINELMHDKDYLYKSLTRDLYFLGKVLNRKYLLLRISYIVFVVGLVISIGFFAVNLGNM